MIPVQAVRDDVVSVLREIAHLDKAMVVPEDVTDISPRPYYT